MKRHLIIGSRASKLALWQAEHVQALLKKNGVVTQIKKITTEGDRIQDRSLWEIGGKGLFLKEIEDELVAGTIDLAVHSLKDVPYDLPTGLVIGAILEREDPSDAFVSLKYKSIKDLPSEAKVGTSSLRRLVQLKRKYPHLNYESLRGNVDTRLKKLAAGDFDAIILASAGLIRLGLEKRIGERLDIIPAAAQGAIGIECRAYDEGVLKNCALLNHEITACAVTLERDFLREVQGTCQTPVGCHVTLDPKDLSRYQMKAFVADVDGGNYREVWR
jgi:hydroxymethylbilane synthase